MTTASREKLLNALIGIGQDLASTVDLAPLLDRLLLVSREIFGFENAIIRLYDPVREELSTVAAYGYPPEVTEPVIRLGQGIMGRVAAGKKPVLVSDLSHEADYLPGIAGARSELAVPMLVRDRLIGVFNVESPLPGAFCDADIEPLCTLAGQAAIAIENARLYDRLRAVSDEYRRLHHLNERILNSASLGIYALDANLAITAWNRRMTDMSGIAAEAAIGRNLFALFPGLEEEGFGERLRAVLASGRAEKLQLAHRNLDGSIRFQKRRITPLKENDETIGAVVTVEDITEFRQLLEQTVHMEKLVEVGRLSAALAHEVNNPLAIITYAAQLLLREEPISPFQQEIVEKIAGEAERLRSLTGSLLSFSRVQEENFQPTSVNKLLQDVFSLLRFELVRHRIALTEEVAPELPLIDADVNRLKQVLINLVNNAVQAMGEGGELRISAAAEPGRIVLTIGDNGPGMTPEILARVFDSFFTTKAEGEGTGLGLYICRHIILEHQGTIDITSPPGAGTTVRIVLPEKRLSTF